MTTGILNRRQVAVAGCFLFFGYILQCTALELRLSGQNEARYARGLQPGQADQGHYGYLEDYLEISADMGKFHFHLRNSLRLPSEFGRRSSGLEALDNRYVEYRSEHVNLRGGDFFRTWGRGLLFGSVELLELNFDSGLDGILVEGAYNDFDAALFRGVETDTTRDFREAAEGAWLSYRTPLGVRLGASAIYLDGGVRHPVIERLGYEVEADFDFGSLFATYVSDRLDADPVRYHYGFYTAGSLFGSGWAVFGEYRNYKLFTYIDPDPAAAVALQPSLQYPPTGIPEVTMYLFDRHPRLTHFYDDVGYQFEFTYTYDFWDFSLNVNQSSEQDADGLVPRLQEKYSPYQAVFLHVERDPWEGDRVVFQGGYHEDVEFTETAAGGYSLWFKRYGGGVVYEHPFRERYAVMGDAQVMGADDMSRDVTYWDQYVALTISRSPDLSLTAMFERSEAPETGGLIWESGFVGGEGRYWPSAELTINFLERHQARIFFGHERGGLRCTGGVCRYVNPFQGVKVIFTSQF